LPVFFLELLRPKKVPLKVDSVDSVGGVLKVPLLDGMVSAIT